MNIVKELQKHPWQFVCIGVLSITIIYIAWLELSGTSLAAAQYECPIACNSQDCIHNK